MIPDLLDAWWDATREQRLVLQRCGGCGTHQHHPRAVCTTCGATDRLTFVDAAGTGTVTSYTVVHRAPTPDVTPPYRVALVRLDEGPTLLTHLTYDDPCCDDTVCVTWRPLDDGRNLPVFTKRT